LTAEQSKGITPLDPNEAAGLIPAHVSTQDELNEWEQANILKAERWAFERKRKPSDVLLPAFVRSLHKKMFDDTWEWAGQFRLTDKNIGIPWQGIPEGLHNLCEDAKYWLDHRVFEPCQLAAQFHYRLAHIHPFPNGNGRHARLMTDVLLVALGHSRFEWGGGDLHGAGDARRHYIAALRAADENNFDPLYEFLNCT
jgi:Fic-DOC domain mobile mystery protein B